MNLKMLLMKKGLTQLRVAKEMGVHPALISMQVTKQRLLPEKHLDGFCKILEISKEALIESMSEEGDSNE